MLDIETLFSSAMENKVELKKKKERNMLYRVAREDCSNKVTFRRE